MPYPLGTQKSAEEQGLIARVRRLLERGDAKKAAEGTYEAVVPPKEIFQKPSTLVKGLLKLGEKVQDSITKDALGIVSKQVGPKAEVALQDIEANKLLGKLLGGPNAKLANEIIGSKTSHNAELPHAVKILTSDGRTVLIRPGDLERLKLVNDQRAREGRLPLPSPLAPGVTYDKPPVPAHPVIPPTTPHVPAPAMQDPVAVARPNDQQPEPPGRPLLVRFIDP